MRRENRPGNTEAAPKSNGTDFTQSNSSSALRVPSITARCPAKGCPFSTLNCPDHDANGHHREHALQLEWMVRSRPHSSRGGGRRITDEQRRQALADSAWLRAVRVDDVHPRRRTWPVHLKSR